MLIRRVEPKRYLGLRIVATLIDYTIYFVLFLLYVTTVGDKADDGGYTVTGWLFFPIPAFWFLYFVALEGYNQSTPGHDICKLIVVKSDGGKIDMIDALKRRVFDIIDILIYGIPAIVVICNTPKYQRLGDVIADTLVVKRSDVTETEVIFKDSAIIDHD